MARLQILELPTEHHGDDMITPWLLVIDQVDDETAADIARWPDDIAKRTGARHVLCFTETIDIPVNETPVDPDGYPLKFRVEGDFETFREQVQDEIRSVEIRLARAVREARTAASPDTWIGRPTHPDGTPYSYSQIVANGWEPCDGCQTWGQWTLANPHDCPRTYIKSPAATVPPDA